MSLQLGHHDTFSVHSSQLILLPISYALSILTFYTCLALWFLTVSCQRNLTWTQLSPSIPDNSLLYCRTGHLQLHAPVSNDLRDNRHKCAQMKLPHYRLLLTSLQPNSPTIPPSHPPSVSAAILCVTLRCCLWHVEWKGIMVCSYPHTHTHTQTHTQANKNGFHGRTMMLHTLSVLSTHTSI